MKDAIVAGVAALSGLAVFQPWADQRDEGQLTAAYEQVVQHNLQRLAQATEQQDPGAKLRQRQREFDKFIQDYKDLEVQYIWSPEGHLRGWQEPDGRGQIQQYNLDGTWEGTITR